MPFFAGGAATAQGLLQAITTAVITVTTLTFSLTVITLQLASSQYSPRLLRGFLRDRGTQAVLSILLSTAAYSLIVLRSIDCPKGEGMGSFRSSLCQLAVLLAIVSIFALVYFLDHVTTEIRVDTMLARVRRSTSEHHRTGLPSDSGVQAARPVHTPIPARTPHGPAKWLSPGRRRRWDQKLASEHGLSFCFGRESAIRRTRHTGGWVWSSPSEPTIRWSHSAERDHRPAPHRRLRADRRSGRRIRLSSADRRRDPGACPPGINDPTTAITRRCISPIFSAGGTATDGRRGAARRQPGDLLSLTPPPVPRLPRGLGRTSPLVRERAHAVASATLRLLADVHDSCFTVQRRESVRDQARRLMEECATGSLPRGHA